MSYTCHAVVLVCHLGPVTWQMFLLFHVISTPIPFFLKYSHLKSPWAQPTKEKHPTKIQELCQSNVYDCTGIKYLDSHSDQSLVSQNQVTEMLLCPCANAFFRWMLIHKQVPDLSVILRRKVPW